ncbi:MAG: hypothetical protein LUF34_05810 [Lachnospiraceae bacterium]|nr:hypothetical protein [Lachnospiraceae bacterium]
MSRKEITIEEQMDLIKYNRSVLYRIPVAYENLNRALSEDLRQDLLSLYKWLCDIKMFRYHGRYTFYADNDTLTYCIRRKQTKAVTNRHFNYLCAIGLINKSDPNTEINKGFIKENPVTRVRPMNTYFLKRYIPEELERLDKRAGLLMNAGVTPGNISNDKLKIAGLIDLAKEIYPLNNENSIVRKKAMYDMLLDKIKEDITEYGFCSKTKLYEYECFSDNKNKIDKLLRIFREDIKDKYYYKPPTKEEKVKYGLTRNNWIFTERGTNEKKSNAGGCDEENSNLE